MVIWSLPLNSTRESYEFKQTLTENKSVLCTLFGRSDLIGLTVLGVEFITPDMGSLIREEKPQLGNGQTLPFQAPHALSQQGGHTKVPSHSPSHYPVLFSS